MINPVHYRPYHAKRDHDLGEEGTEETDWEDNQVSNALAWASATFLPAWCQTDTHWTSRFAATLFTTCPCCMIFRGITIGILISAPPWLVLLLIVLLTVP